MNCSQELRQNLQSDAFLMIILLRRYHGVLFIYPTRNRLLIGRDRGPNLTKSN